MGKKLISGLALTAQVLLAGCATYHASVLSSSDGATVGAEYGAIDYCLIEKIDGHSRKPWIPPYGPVLVDPGKRVFTVSAASGVHSLFFTDFGRAELNATLQAGHAYLIRFNDRDKLMTFWIEDSQTHEVASDKPSIHATSSLKP